ncbi:MAG: helix-hairpin-helix domain-containing protein [Myxococcales bacterium]|nr:helix-hairpin-helix domain-containing protein [Myxococcales bacterium]
MSAPRREWVTGSVVVILALGVLPPTGDPERATPHRCAVAVAVDGALRCDDGAPATVGELCGPAHPRASQPVHGGDAIDTTALCQDDVGPSRMPATDLAALGQPTCLNGASLEELEGLPGVGPKLAARIVAARPFDSVDALAEVRGVGPATLDRLRPRLVARPAEQRARVPADRPR